MVSFAGFSGATRVNASNAAAMFPVLAPFAERAEAGLTFEATVAAMRAKLAAIPDARIVVIPPPPVRGLGNGGGFKYQVQDVGNVGLAGLEASTNELAGRANGDPRLTQVFTTFRSATPQYYLDLDREKARMLDVPISEVFQTLNVYLAACS